MPPSTLRTPLRRRWLVAVSLLILAAGVGALAAQGTGSRHQAPLDGLQLLGWPGGSEGLAGAETCAVCHAGIAEAQEAHPMALSGAAVATGDSVERFFSAERLELPVRWRSESDAPDRPRYFRSDEGAALGIADAGRELPVHAVFGSGLRGETPVHFPEGGGMREMRVSWSAGFGTWIETPGSENDRDPLGDLDSSEAAADCIGCHATAVRWENGVPDLPGSEWGVRCERCHGPGAAHAGGWEAGAGGPVFNPGSLTPSEQVVFCGQCHRLPSDIEPLEVLRRDRSLVRHAGASLMMSGCFRESPPESAVSCLACHDPHRAEPAEVVAERSRLTCLGCHADPVSAHRYERVTLDSDCLGCHMPAVEDVFPGAGFTDHWIRVRGAPPALGSPQWEAEIAWLEALTRNALARPNRPRKEARLAIGLGEILQAQGLGESAVRAIRRGLDRDPDYGQVLKAAAILRSVGQTEAAAQALERATGMDPEAAQGWFDLGALLHAEQDSSAAVAALERARALQPGSPAVLSLLGAAYRDVGRMDAALESGLDAVSALEASAAGPPGLPMLEAWLELGITRRARRETAEAVDALGAAHRLAPDWPPALDALARLLALDPDTSVRDVPEAVRLAERLAGLSGYQDPQALDLLAAVHAVAGDFALAIRAAERALAGLDGDAAAAATLEGRLALYRAGEVWVEMGPARRFR